MQFIDHRFWFSILVGNKIGMCIRKTRDIFFGDFNRGKERHVNPTKLKKWSRKTVNFLSAKSPQNYGKRTLLLGRSPIFICEVKTEEFDT